MPKMVEEISQAYKDVIGKSAKEHDTPGFPGKTLNKYEGEPVYHEEYRSIVGKMMYLITKTAPDI